MESPIDDTMRFNNGLDVIQGLIDISTDRLEGLRTQCVTSSKLTQHEIRCLEAKLVRMFSEFLITKVRLPGRVPASGLSPSPSELKQWLRVVGISPATFNVCAQKIEDLEGLLELDDDELRKILGYSSSFREEEVRRMIDALDCLRRCRKAFEENLKEPDHLCWDSWDLQSNHHRYQRTAVSPKTNRAIYKQKAVQTNETCYDILSPPLLNKTLEAHRSARTLTPSPSPPNSPRLTARRVNQRKSTSPSKKKHQVHLGQYTTHNGSSTTSSTTLGSSSQDLFVQDNAVGNMATYISSNSTSMPQAIPRTTLHTNSNPDSHSPSLSSDILMENSNNQTVPRSPCTPITSLGMGHVIAHRFSTIFKILTMCDFCQKQMFFGLRCKECKYHCHKDCQSNVPPSCGLPREFVDEFKKKLASPESFVSPANISPNLSLTSRSGNTVGHYSGHLQRSGADHYHHDNSSPGSSCNSSSPSSPALLHQLHTSTTNSAGGSSTPSVNTSTGPHPTPSSLHTNITQFTFPDDTCSLSNQQQTTQTLFQGSTITKELQQNPSNASDRNSMNSVITVDSRLTTTTRIPTMTVSVPSAPPNPLPAELADTNKSNDSDKTLSLTGSASTDSDRTPVRIDSTEEGDSGTWARQNSTSLKEWDIPYDDLRLLEQIGSGRFGTVHRGIWHGDVAVKLFKYDLRHDEHMLEAFKLELANFKATRHENLVLFMGCCINPTYLAIVTSLCKGNTLYTYIHQRRDKFTINRSTLVALQISNGMSYLHAKDMLHKDLRTKNIFIENGKVVISDFGLFNSTRLMYSDYGLGIPSGWLCYLAPELMRELRADRRNEETLTFSKGTDVYSFGTIWYELLCAEFPFKPHPPETIIWQVGRGMKPTLANLHTSRDVKDILMLCWSFQSDDRPDFGKLMSLLERLPKKRLARSPSHPVQLSRSAESVF